MKNQGCVFLGTGSDVGKSLIVAAFCRLLKNIGIDVAPFKAQNMSNNSWVTPDGKEIGRAQALQAYACGLEINAHMNPVLLKPNSDMGSQVVIQGQVWKNYSAKEYYQNHQRMQAAAWESLDHMLAEHEYLVVEGAGSCGEVNLRSRDFVNFETAHKADLPVILIADIDRGGVFAQIVGTLAVIPPQDKACVKGILINRFRGDASLFTEGVDWIEKETDIPVLGVIPWMKNLQVDPEDGVILYQRNQGQSQEDEILIGVVQYPGISNFNDILPLERESRVRVEYYQKPPKNPVDWLILPGCKNSSRAAEFVMESGWDQYIQAHHQQKRHLLGICGGYQILGKVIRDPNGVENPHGKDTLGLGIIPMETTLESEKVLRRTHGHIAEHPEVFWGGYEVHMGKSEHFERALAECDSGPEGYLSQDGKVWGTYMHGLWEDASTRQYFLEQIDAGFQLDNKMHENEWRDQQLDAFAEQVKNNLAMEKVAPVLGVEL